MIEFALRNCLTKSAGYVLRSALRGYGLHVEVHRGREQQRGRRRRGLDLRDLGLDRGLDHLPTGEWDQKMQSSHIIEYVTR